MRLDDAAGEAQEKSVPSPAVAEQPTEFIPARRSHLVAMVTRALAQADQAEAGDTIRGRFWNPHERRWNETDFDTLDSLRRRYIEEGGWELLQEQQLDTPQAVELIFKAHRIDFTRPSREQVLRDIGMTPNDVDDLLRHVDREQEG